MKRIKIASDAFANTEMTVQKIPSPSSNSKETPPSASIRPTDYPIPSTNSSKSNLSSINPIAVPIAPEKSSNPATAPKVHVPSTKSSTTIGHINDLSVTEYDDSTSNNCYKRQRVIEDDVDEEPMLPLKIRR